MKEIISSPAVSPLISVYLPSLSVILLFVCHMSRVTGSGPGTHVMKCYVGNCTTFEECRRPELISDCPNDQLYDACTSIIVQKAYGKLTVEKKCGFSSSCSDTSHYWWSDECDRKSDEDSYTCTTCCSDTMCNHAPSIISTTESHRVLTYSLLLVSFYYQLSFKIS